MMVQKKQQKKLMPHRISRKISEEPVGIATWGYNTDIFNSFIQEVTLVTYAGGEYFSRYYIEAKQGSKARSLKTEGK